MRTFFKKYGALLICLLIPLAVGGLASLATRGAMPQFEAVNKPPLAPPGWVFPVVWTILYILMGVSSYLVYRTGCAARALTVYGVSLVFNFFWPVFFFVCRIYIVSLVWLLVLWLLVIIYTAAFYGINKKAGLLQIPYCVWCAFAVYLNFGVVLLN